MPKHLPSAFVKQPGETPQKKSPVVRTNRDTGGIHEENSVIWFRWGGSFDEPVRKDTRPSRTSIRK